MCQTDFICLSQAVGLYCKRQLQLTEMTQNQVAFYCLYKIMAFLVLMLIWEVIKQNVKKRSFEQTFTINIQLKDMHL